MLPFFFDVDGGIEVTASHNPIEYNGFKFIGPKARPFGLGEEFSAFRKLVDTAAFTKSERRGTLSATSIVPSYTDLLLRLVDVKKFRPLLSPLFWRIFSQP